MTFPFRHNASRPEKLFTLFFICVGILDLYGFTLKFDPSGTTWMYASLFSIPLCLIILVPLLTDERIKDHHFALEPFSQFLFVLQMLILSFGMTLVLLAVSIPGIYTDLFGTEKSAQFLIVEKSDGSHFRDGKFRCRYSIKVKEVESEFKAGGCTTYEQWRPAGQGDTVNAKYRYTDFGKTFMYIEH